MKVFDREGCQTLEQVAQKGCRFFITADIQNPSGNSPSLSALVDYALISGMGLSTEATSNLHNPVKLIYWILFYKVHHKEGNVSYKTSIKKEDHVSDEVRLMSDNTWNYFQGKKTSKQTKQAKKEGMGS